MLQEQADDYAVLNAGLLDKHVGAFAHFSCNAYGSVAAQFLWQITDSSIPPGVEASKQTENAHGTRSRSGRRCRARTWLGPDEAFRAGRHASGCGRAGPGKLEPLASAESKLGVRFEACNATQPPEVAKLFGTVERELGLPSLVVFNAGVFERGGILEITPEDFERCWRLGCFGGFLVGQAAARLMVTAGAGTILFTGATASLRGGAGFANLAVPKFGLRSLNRWRASWDRRGSMSRT